MPLAFADFPGTPVGVIVWDGNHTFPGRYSELLRRIRCLFSGKRYASLKHLCEKNQLRYAECDKRDTIALKNTLKSWNAELVITSGCAIVPTAALSSVRFGGINLHPSKLPDWRGANPLFWQLASAQNQWGVTVHVLSDQIDGGEIIAQTTVNRIDGLSRQQITQILEGEAGVALLKKSVQQIGAGTATPITQPSTTTPYARRVQNKDLANAVPLATLEPTTVWNLLRFLGHVPNDWLGIQGWQSGIHWQACKFTKAANSLLSNTGKETEESGQDWTLEPGRLTIDLVNRNGRITLIPKRLTGLYWLYDKLGRCRHSSSPTISRAGR